MYIADGKTNGPAFSWPDGKRIAVMVTFDYDAEFLRISRAKSAAARKFLGDTKLFVNGTARNRTPSPRSSPLPFAAAVTSQPSERSAARYGR